MGSNCPGILKRDYSSVNFAPVMHSHFNHSVGKPISDMKQFTDALKRKSDEATERTGIPHNFVPADHDSLRAPDV